MAETLEFLTKICKFDVEDIEDMFRAAKKKLDDDNQPIAHPLVVKLKSKLEAMSYCND